MRSTIMLAVIMLAHTDESFWDNSLLILKYFFNQARYWYDLELIIIIIVATISVSMHISEKFIRMMKIGKVC